MMSGSGQASVPNAHQAAINAVEVTQYNGTDVIFSAGLDQKLKAWRIDRSNASSPQIVPLEERDVQTPIHCLQVLNHSIVVAGCENGKLAIWDLNSNNLNHMDIS